MSALKWYHVVSGLTEDVWVLADTDADWNWIGDQGLADLRITPDGWSAHVSLSARGPETAPEGVRAEALEGIKKRLRELLNRLETEEVVP